MYTILTTCPDYGSRNVGDKLIEVRTKEMILREKGDDEFFTIFREEPLEPHLDTINRSKAVIMPLAVRDTPMYPGTYKLTEDLSAIKVPLIPIGACWNVYPGDSKSRERVEYSKATVDFLHYLSKGVEKFSCREHYTVEVLKKHGVGNACFTGDPAWFHLPSIGKSLRRPKKVNKVVFSAPLSPYYLDQAKSVITMLAEEFPKAERYCAMHLADSGVAEGAVEGGETKSENSAAMTPEVARKNREIRMWAESQGFSVLEMAGDIEKLNFYEECDLHVGYECHAHLFFFSRRIPSVLIAEDARGVGFNYSLGYGGFTGFVRTQEASKVKAKTHTSGYCTSLEELVLAPPKNDLHREIRSFIAEEAETNFARYIGLDVLLDTIYTERMRPFILALP